MLALIGRLFPYHRLRLSNKAIKVLIISDAIFFSGMGLAEIVFSVFIITNIEGANVTHLGIGNALFMLGILLTEPIFSKFYDASKNTQSPFYGYILGNLLKSAFRLLFVFINSINMFYVVFFILGIVHAIEYPSFSKLFTCHIDQGSESFEWGVKDVLISGGKLLTFFISGYIALYFGYNALFIVSAAVMFLAGVLLPWFYRKEFIG